MLESLQSITKAEEKPEDIGTTFNEIYQAFISITTIEKGETLDDVSNAILSGNVVFYLDRIDTVIIINAMGGETRSIEQSITETIVRGRRTAFVENLITFRIYNAKSKVKINAENPDHLKINVKIGVEGGIAEVFGMKHLNHPETLKQIEKIASKKVEELVNDIIDKAQSELNPETFRFYDKMRERHYRTWEKMKNDWDQGENYFAKSVIQVSAKVKIRTAGATDKTKSDGGE